MRTRSLMILFLIAVLMVALAAMAVAADPFIGTWKLNLAKSQFAPGQAPKSQTNTNEALANGMFKLVLEGVEGDGKAFRYECTYKYDGKAYPTKGDPNSDTVAFRKTGPNTVEYVVKKGGKTTFSGRSIVSKDGKTQSSHDKQIDSSGKEITSMSFYDKQ